MNTQLLDNNKEARLVINATRVSEDFNTAEIFEFALNLNLEVILCSHVKSVSQGRYRLINDFSEELSGVLFEINHVRVNPNLNNELILYRLKKVLQNSGVEITSPSEDILMSICYKPLGDLKQIVRFYIKDKNTLVFLTDNVKLQVV